MTSILGKNSKYTQEQVKIHKIIFHLLSVKHSSLILNPHQVFCLFVVVVVVVVAVVAVVLSTLCHFIYLVPFFMF